MSRVIAVGACGLFLAGCSSWMPSFDMPSLGGGSTPASLAVESDPPGARASAAGSSCVTPCRLNVAANEPFSVNVALDGYVPQSVPVRIVQPDDPRLGSEDTGGGPHLDPNPVYVELERAPSPAPAAKKKKAVKRPATAEAPIQSGASAPTTAAASATLPPPAAPAADTPWPMPR